MKGIIKINRNKTCDSFLSKNDKSEIQKDLCFGNNHLLKDYLKNFKLSQKEFEEIKAKFEESSNTQEYFINKLQQQSDSIFIFISKFYNEFIDKLEAISEQISNKTNCIEFIQETSSGMSSHDIKNKSNSFIEDVFL